MPSRAQNRPRAGVGAWVARRRYRQSARRRCRYGDCESARRRRQGPVLGWQSRWFTKSDAGRASPAGAVSQCGLLRRCLRRRARLPPRERTQCRRKSDAARRGACGRGDCASPSGRFSRPYAMLQFAEARLAKSTGCR